MYSTLGYCMLYVFAVPSQELESIIDASLTQSYVNYSLRLPSFSLAMRVPSCRVIRYHFAKLKFEDSASIHPCDSS